jgi:hypothetical protein
MFNWIKRLFGFQETLEEVRQEKDRRAQRIVTPSKITYAGKQRYIEPSPSARYTNTSAMDEDRRRRLERDSDTGVGSFVTGFALGSLLNSGSDSPSPSYVDSSPSFDGFSGGASGGGGADSSWDSAPSCDTSSSFDSGSSSFDSGSSCGDFSGGGSSDFGS